MYALLYFSATGVQSNELEEKSSIRLMVLIATSNTPVLIYTFVLICAKFLRRFLRRFSHRFYGDFAANFCTDFRTGVRLHFAPNFRITFRDKFPSHFVPKLDFALLGSREFVAPELDCELQCSF